MKNMKKNYRFSLLLGSCLLLLGATIGCVESKKQDEPTLALALVNGVPDTPSEIACVTAYTVANSCVGGVEFFNPGIGCASSVLAGFTEAQLLALNECVLAQVNGYDPLQPCNLPQFKYPLAQQALAGAFAACNGVYTTAAGVDQDLTGLLVY